MSLPNRAGYPAGPMDGGKTICAGDVFTLLPRRCRGEHDGVTKNDLVDDAADPITERELAFTKK